MEYYFSDQQLAEMLGGHLPVGATKINDHAPRDAPHDAPGHAPGPSKPPLRLLTLIHQQAECDCGVAVAAMLAGRSLADGFAALPQSNPCHRDTRGLWVQEFLSLAEKLTGSQWRVVTPKRTALSSHRFISSIGAAIIRANDGRRLGHWVAYCRRDVDGEMMIYDPEMAWPMLVGNYDRADWLVIRDVRPGP